jgi:hypothetical protein
MKAVFAIVIAALALSSCLGGCATGSNEPGKVVAEDRFAQLVVPGRTTRAELLAAFGPTKTVSFDSGMEAWLYEADAAGGRHTELVLLLDRAGVVQKMRRRPPYPSDPQR